VLYKKNAVSLCAGNRNGLFSPSGVRISFFGYPVHNLRNRKRGDDFFLKIVPPRETLVGWEEYLPCIL
jgi:hypothetical protein